MKSNDKYRIGAFSQNTKTPPTEYDNWKAAPTDENYSNLMQSLEPTIQSGIKSYAGGEKNLTTRARILTTKALQTYDPKRGASLKTHVHHNLKGLSRFRAQRDRVVHVPESVRTDSTSVNEFINKYQDKKGIEPTDLEVSNSMGISPKRVAKARGRGELSAQEMSTEKGDLPSEGKDMYKVWMDYVYHDMDDRNRKIMEWTTGYNNSKVIPKKEIARRLKITPAAVSLRISKIAYKLGEVNK